MNSLAEESKHYRSNLELEKAPEVLHFVLTDISNKLSRRDETNSDSESSHTYHSYQVIRERLYTSALEAQSLIKESQISNGDIKAAPNTAPEIVNAEIIKAAKDNNNSSHPSVHVKRKKT